MARESVNRDRRKMMDNETKTRPFAQIHLQGSITQSQSLLNVSELETRAKATVQDINELFTALQELMPKSSQNRRGLAPNRTRRRSNRVAASGTDTDTANASDDWSRARLLRRYNSEKYRKKTWKDDNMNDVPETGVEETPHLNEMLPEERLFASDTEAELQSNVATKQERRAVQRQFSLPVYEENGNETPDETDATHKRSKFSIFRRGEKPGKKKHSTWLSFFSTLSLRRKKSKKRSKNKTAHAVALSSKNNNKPAGLSPKYQAAQKSSSPSQERSPKAAPRLSSDLAERGRRNSAIRGSRRKRNAPPPPILIVEEFKNETEVRDRKNTMETKSDEVQKKLNAWYKHAVKETHSSSPKEVLRPTRSYDNLLTDTEVIRKRGTFTSDTDSTSTSSKDKNKIHVPKTRVRKTRARRNRRRAERARFHSLPNVKLVTRALEEAKGKVPATMISNAGNKGDVTDDVTDDVTESSQLPTITPVEAKLSFGSTLESDEPTAELIKQQRDSDTTKWVTRQGAKTTASCIRPLQLNLFYSESPSRETIHKSRSMICKPRATDDGRVTGKNAHDFAFKIYRSSSRKRKRRSFKRQTRLPYYSPFYVPNTLPSKLHLEASKGAAEDESQHAKDSGLGSPDSVHDNRFASLSVNKRDQRLAKLHSESEDSGWGSTDRHFTHTADTGIQTDPVIVMTAVSKVRRQVLPHVIKGDNGQSEA